MRNILFFIFVLIFVSSCGVSNRVVTIGNVSVYSSSGEKVRTYNNVVFEEVPVQDTMYKVSFIEQNGTMHYINGTMVVVEGVEQIVEPSKPTSTTSVIVYPYGYYRPYYNSYYYHRPYHYPRHNVSPRPVPKPQPRPQSRPRR